jgi:hypothetical protein
MGNAIFYVFNNVNRWNSASSQEALGVPKTPAKNGLTKILAHRVRSAEGTNARVPSTIKTLYICSQDA